MSFHRPVSAARLAVNVMVDAPASSGSQFFIDYDPSSPKVLVGSGGTTDMLSLLPDDKTIDLTLYVDNTFAEAFWMNGRVAMTIDTPTSGGADDVTIGADKPGVTVSATAWEVGSIWVTPDEVKQTPRRDSVV